MQRLHARVADHLDELPAGVWEHVTQHARLFMQAPFLRALEDAPTETASPKYALLYQDTTPVAALAGQLLTIHVDRAAPGGKPDGALAKLASSALEHVDIDVALWGNFLTWGHCGVAFAPEVDEAKMWPRVSEAIYRLRRDDRALKAADLYLVLDVPPEQVAGASHLQAHGFDAFETEPDMHLELAPSWTSYEDYLGALKTKYRKAAKDLDGDLRAAGCSVGRLDDVEKHADVLFELYRQVHERSPHRFVTLEPGSIPALAQRLGDRFICNVVARGDRILGFGTTLIDGDAALAYFVGHDVEQNRELPIYLRLLQVAIVDGIQHGCRRVVYGRTALEPKARLGATPVPLTVYGRHKNRLVTSLISGLMQSITPHEEPPKRRPFKVAKHPSRSSDNSREALPE